MVVIKTSYFISLQRATTRKILISSEGMVSSSSTTLQATIVEKNDMGNCEKRRFRDITSNAQPI